MHVKNIVATRQVRARRRFLSFSRLLRRGTLKKIFSRIINIRRHANVAGNNTKKLKQQKYMTKDRLIVRYITNTKAIFLRPYFAKVLRRTY